MVALLACAPARGEPGGEELAEGEPGEFELVGYELTGRELDVGEFGGWMSAVERTDVDWVDYQLGELLPRGLPAVWDAGEGLAALPDPPEELPPPDDEDVPPEPEPDEGMGEAVTPLEVSPELLDWPELLLWDGSFELGFNGSTGNTDTQDLRIGAHTKRKTKQTIVSLDFDYRKATRNQMETAHRMFFEWRIEWPFEARPLSTYLHGTTEYDQFRAFDVRVTQDGGFGYQLVKTEVTAWTTRGGCGVSREIGGPMNRFVPEGVAGSNFERKLTKRQNFTASVEFFFDWTDFTENRINTKASWSVILDEEAHLSLKLGLIDRYDSTPNGARPNDLDYSAVLLWNF